MPRYGPLSGVGMGPASGEGEARGCLEWPSLGTVAGMWAGGTMAHRTAAPRWPSGSGGKGGSADGPSSRTRHHSAGRWWGQHTRWVSGGSDFDVGGADSWRVLSGSQQTWVWRSLRQPVAERDGAKYGDDADFAVKAL